MDKMGPHPDVLRLIRVTSLLWLVYLAVLAVISRIFQPLGFSNFLYYILLAYVPVICLGLAYWPWIQEHLGRLFIPLVVFLITVIPILINWLLAGSSPFGQLFPSSAGPLLGLLPFMLLALLLVAWQYKWQVTLLVVLGIAVLNLLVTLGIYGLNEPVTGSLNIIATGSGTLVTTRSVVQGALMLTLSQTIVFLAVGFSVTYLVGTLRRNQHSLESANVRLAHYASTLEHLATSRERNRLARELHDTLAHTLSGLSVQLETAKAYWDVDPQAAHAMLDKSSAIARSGLEETRRALKALRASQLDDLGLAQAIGAIAKDASTHGKFALRLAIADDFTALSPDVEQGIYRIAQEAIQNTVNHASARELTVSLSFTDGKTTLVVSDDGIGFAPEKRENSNHFGLSGMEERAKLIGGELLIASSPGLGTTVKLMV